MRRHEPCASGVGAEFTFTVPEDAGALTLEAWATGIVSGHLEAWKDYPAYDCSDLIGGSAVVTMAAP